MDDAPRRQLLPFLLGQQLPAAQLPHDGGQERGPARALHQGGGAGGGDGLGPGGSRTSHTPTVARCAGMTTPRTPPSRARGTAAWCGTPRGPGGWSTTAGGEAAAAAH